MNFPDIASRQALIPLDAGKPSIREDETLPANAGGTANRGRQYNYYVLRHDKDIVYNKEKTTEQLVAGQVGTMVDIYV